MNANAYTSRPTVDGLADDDTRCAGCGRLLIRRRGFGVAASDLVQGACPGCGRHLAGIGLAEDGAP